jgi:ribosome maturation factor RimP
MDVVKEIADRLINILPKDQFVVDILVKGSDANPKILILVDGDQGITIDDVAKTSKRLGAQMEEEELMNSPYTLEVSSAGVDHPLKHLRQYHKNIGRTVRVDKLDGERKEGKLVKVTEEAITLQRSGKKNNEEFDISFDQINKTMVLVTFKK